MNLEDEAPIRIGISSCLLGQRVRYDGGHKRDAFLVSQLGRFVEWVAVCPEVEVGMGVPRPTLRLVRRGGAPRLVERDAGTDHTDAMQAWARRRVAKLADLDLAGYVLKKDSPSCGMERVRVYGEKGMPRKDGRGVFAAALLDGLPLLPVEEEGRLNDPRLRESFIERVFAYRRLRRLFAGHWRHGQLVAFHTAHKLQILAHAPEAYSQLGRLVATGRRLERAELRARYESAFMRALASMASRGRNTNVLQHMAGYVREHLDADGRSELAELIRDYRRGLVPLVVPVTLLRHYTRRFSIAYLAGQVYLEPHPKELMLRNHV